MVDPVPELLGAERLFAELGHGCRQRIARQAAEIALLVEGVPHGPRGRGEDGGMLAHGALDRPSGERKPADSGADSAGPAADSTARSPVRSPDRPGWTRPGNRYPDRKSGGEGKEG